MHFICNVIITFEGQTITRCPMFFFSRLNLVDAQLAEVFRFFEEFLVEFDVDSFLIRMEFLEDWSEMRSQNILWIKFDEY